MTYTGSVGVEKDIKPKVQSEFKELVKLIKRLQKQIDTKDAEIKRLTKKVEKCSKSKEDVLLNYIAEIKQLQLSYQPEPGINDGSNGSEEIIDIKPKKKKSKKKKRKR
jgi:hypothetical protein